MKKKSGDKELSSEDEDLEEMEVDEDRESKGGVGCWKIL